MGELVSRALPAVVYLLCVQISLTRGWKVWREGRKDCPWRWVHTPGPIPACLLAYEAADSLVQAFFHLKNGMAK